MKASFAMLVATAALAVASPLNKRKYVTTYDTETVTAYVYPDGSATAAASTSTTAYHRGNRKRPSVTTTTSVVQTPESVYVAPTSASENVYVTTVVYGASLSTSVSASVSLSVSLAPTSYASYSASPTATSSASTDDSVSGKTLSSHNQHRTNHSANALEWDGELASYAETSARKCKFAHDLTPGGGGYGQNIAMYGSSTKMPNAATAIEQAVTNMWYNGELQLYPGYGSEPDMTNFEEWGHFTQVVWKDTEKVGCASYKCAAGTISSMESWFTVCNYSPAGNFGGEYAANVASPKGMVTVSVNV